MKLRDLIKVFLKTAFTPAPDKSSLGQSTPFKFALLFSFLLMVFSMLAIAFVYSQSYSANQLVDKQRLSKEMLRLSSVPKHHLLLYLPTDMRAVKLPAELPEGVKREWTEYPGMISSKAIKKLKLSKYGVHERSWVALVHQDTGYVGIFLPFRPVQMLSIIKLLCYLSIAIIVTMSLYGALINRRAMSRIETINETANSILRGDMNKRIAQSPHKRDEYSNLVNILNEMLETMQQLMRDLRQVNQNIAHDLKTPLNRLRSRLESALIQDENKVNFPETVADSIEDIDALLSIFNALLLMGNLDAKVTKYPLKPLALKDLLYDLGDLYGAIAEEKHHQLQIVIHDNLNVMAHKDLLSQCISNLLDNAIKYTPDNGRIVLSLRKKAEFAVISIADSGPGIPDADKDEIFEPFSRLDASRHLPGNGLGMSLVRSIIKVHHGRIELLDNEPGLLVNVYFRVSSQENN